jgi:hypothetical protein
MALTKLKPVEAPGMSVLRDTSGIRVVSNQTPPPWTSARVFEMLRMSLGARAEEIHRMFPSWLHDQVWVTVEHSIVHLDLIPPPWASYRTPIPWDFIVAVISGDRGHLEMVGVLIDKLMTEGGEDAETLERMQALVMDALGRGQALRRIGTSNNYRWVDTEEHER